MTDIKAEGKIEAPSASDSPLIGIMAQENLQTTRKLFAETAAQSDVVVFVGDMYDHIRNCHPGVYLQRSGLNKAFLTGNLWNYLDYNRYKDKGGPGKKVQMTTETGDVYETTQTTGDYELYPRYIDAMLALELIYRTYASGTPVIFLAGNHEGYEDAMGISPRLTKHSGIVRRRSKATPLRRTILAICTKMGKA